MGLQGQITRFVFFGVGVLLGTEAKQPGGRGGQYEGTVRGLAGRQVGSLVVCCVGLLDRFVSCFVRRPSGDG